jgi:hypothetical protein
VVTQSRRWPRRLAQVVLGLAVVALVVAGVVAVGNVARNALGPQDRYLLPFGEIECPAPPGQDRAEFLGEVQYIGLFPDKVNVLDPTLPDRLRTAFAAHKRVARVNRVELLPPKRIQVELTFRPAAH